MSEREREGLERERERERERGKEGARGRGREGGRDNFCSPPQFLHDLPRHVAMSSQFFPSSIALSLEPSALAWFW